jgi:hypothetical protein
MGERADGIICAKKKIKSLRHCDKKQEVAGRLAQTTKNIYETKLEKQNGSVHPD